MIRSWWRRRRRRAWLAGPFPEAWTAILDRNVPYTRRLNEDELSKLRQLVRVFIPEKHWEGCNGLLLTDEIQVTIAAQACLLLLGFESDYFDDLSTILVYPGTYVAEERSFGPAGVVTEGSSPRLGESWHRGPIVLSWTSAAEGGKIPDDGSNVVLHEFAHHVEMHGRDIDGDAFRSLLPGETSWLDVMLDDYEEFMDDLRMGRPALLDSYAAKNEREFFAVATEAFFERPAALSQRRPRLYAALRVFYRQHPLERLHRSPAR